MNSLFFYVITGLLIILIIILSICFSLVIYKKNKKINIFAKETKYKYYEKNQIKPNTNTVEEFKKTTNLEYEKEVENIYNDISNKNNIKLIENDFFRDMARQFNKNPKMQENVYELYSFIQRGDKNSSKLILTLKEFKNIKAIDILLSLFTNLWIDDISDSEKNSWLSNISPLKSLFFHEKNNKYLENTWLIFEWKIDWKVNKEFDPKYHPLRTDLLIITKVGEEYKVVILELKQWSCFNGLEPQNLSQKIKIDKQLSNQYKLINENFNRNNSFPNEKIDVKTLGFLYNWNSNLNTSLLNSVENNDYKSLFSTYFNTDMKYKNYYIGIESNELSQRIFTHLTEKNPENISILSYFEVSELLSKISNHPSDE